MCEIARHCANIQCGLDRCACDLGLLQDVGEKIRGGCFRFVGAAPSIRGDSAISHRTFLQTHLLRTCINSAIAHVICVVFCSESNSMWGFVVDKATLEQGSRPVLFPLSVYFHEFSILNHSSLTDTT